MEQAYGYDLEQSRIEKIKTLGLLCYNLYIDGVIVFAGMNETVDSISNSLDYLLMLRQNNSNEVYLKTQESSLNEKLENLGLDCYNLYVDRKLLDNRILTLCASISELNLELNKEITYTGSSAPYDDFDHPHGYRGLYNYRNAVNSADEYDRTSHYKLKITCPSGMEPIPFDFKKCTCGYKNRSDAKYCARCGAKLYV
ncbi:MAG: zinc ribbon domain-containing protein [Oscillospiraceae bacterium]|nr:zinc ribbon domain-containing protein [Oscillospiraceae bacterium]